MIFNKKAASENEKKTTCSLITSFRKLTGLHIIFCAGLLLCFVPSVSCKSAWSERLAYEKIYNSTNSQIQHINKPYSPASHGPYSHSQRTTPHSHKLSEETKVNEVDDELEHLDDKRGKLLVGFARDPFRYSIPEDDYRNGVRTINPQSYKNQKRSKRAVDNLYDMLSCATGCDPLSYMGYGCYCGLGGSGWPVDAIDRCCRRHDKCYDNIDCPHTVYFQPYFWRCSNGIPVCSFKNLFHTDYECTVGLCACDMEFAMCLSRYSCPSEQARC